MDNVILDPENPNRAIVDGNLAVRYVRIGRRVQFTPSQADLLAGVVGWAQVEYR